MSAAPAPLEPPAAGAFEAAGFRGVVGATEAQMADLQTFLGMLSSANQHMNLVGPSALAEFWSRHAYDSAQLLTVAPDAKTWADLGAGAGFPGVILAILLKGRSGVHVHLVESVGKRARFLAEVVEALSLPATVHHARAETLSLNVDIVTARACAPMNRLLGFAWPYLKNGATGLFLKGQDVEVELKEATRYWRFHADLKPSLSHPHGRIVQIKGLSRVRPQ